MKEILIERQNLFEPNNQMAFYVEMSHVPYERLKDAIEQAYLNNESTCCKIVLTENGKAFFQKMEHSACKVGQSDKEWKDIVKEQEKVPFALEQGEMIRCFVCETNNKTGLLVFAHHIVADGLGIICFINDVMNALSGKPLEYKPLRSFTKEDIEKEYRLPLIAKAYVAFCNLRYKLFVNNVYDWDDYYGISHHYWSQFESNILHYTFTKEETDKIRMLAKREKVSVNTFLTTAFIKHNKGKKRVGWIISLREKENDTMANLISGACAVMQYKKQLSFGDNARNIQGRIQKAIKFYKYFVIDFLSSLSPNIIDNMLLHTHGYKPNILMEEVCTVTGYRGRIMARDVGISNLTVLDIANEFGNHVIDKVIVVSPLISYTKTVICCSTFNGQLTLAYHDMIHNGKDNSTYFQQVLSNIKEHL